ncbi:MAG: tetratricopeptide repeat protein [Hyphomicrobiaceae bacterium]|nr:tetratricopeptide repeat protein [Hyphomicrobiaceae bacterium]
MMKHEPEATTSFQTGRISARAAVQSAGMACFVIIALASTAFAAKDSAPSGRCDAFATGSPQWSSCLAPTAGALDDASLFYAGYWMARLERYDVAIAYLSQARNPDARTLTYLGFATRKVGDVTTALGYYQRALALDPDFVVARAYLGEAHLQNGALALARRELGEIARRCGATCAAYDELARHVSRYEARQG